MTVTRIQVIDSHTGGEPTRLVLSGFPDCGSGSLRQQRQALQRDHDPWRRAIMLEPRGNDVIVGALLRPPEQADSVAGIIFFNNAGYLGMCGHGTIGVIRSLHHLGVIEPGLHRLDTPVGTVEATLHDDLSVSVRNVPAWRHRQGVVVEVPELGAVRGDIAWGGNWFFLTELPDERLAADNVDRLTDVARRIKQALAAQGLTGEHGAEIDHIELFTHPADAGLDHGAGQAPAADGRNFVLCPGDAWDRSPCGTGTSAKLACLAAEGRLAAGERWVQESVIGSRFTGWYERVGDAIVPTIQGSAHLVAEATLLIDTDDPFAWGFGRPAQAG